MRFLTLVVSAAMTAGRSAAAEAAAGMFNQRNATVPAALQRDALLFMQKEAGATAGITPSLLLEESAPSLLLEEAAPPVEKHPDAPGLVPAKIGIMVILMSVTLCCSLIPYCFGKQKAFRKWVSPISVFAAGAFLGLACFHLLPEAMSQSEASVFGWTVGKTNNWYSAVYVFMFVGFLLLLFADNVIRAMLPQNTSFSAGCAAEDMDEVREPSCDGKHELVGFSEPCAAPTVSFDASVLLSTLAVVIHSIFEGIIIGLMDSKVTLWISMLVITGHKLPIGLSLGVACLRRHISTAAATCYLFCFAVAAPIGIAIGIGVNSGTAKTSAAFNALSAGVLLYAGSEASLHEFRRSRAKLGGQLSNFVIFVIGAGFVLGMMMVHLNTNAHDHSLHPL